MDRTNGEPAEEFSVNTPTYHDRKHRKPIAPVSQGLGFCSGSSDGFFSGRRRESSEVIEDDVQRVSSMDNPRAAALAQRSRDRAGDGEADAGSDFDGEDAWRAAPAEEDDQPDKIDEREWAGMMSAMDQFLPFEDNSTITPSSSSHYNGDSSGKESFVQAAAREAAFEAIREGKPLLSIPKELRGDKEVVMAAIEREGPYCYDYITSKELKERDRDVVLALVRADGSLLENCSEELRSDKQLVRCALATCSEALKVAPKALQCDKELKAMATTRAKEEQRLWKVMAEEMCGPIATKCVPKR